MSEQIRPTDPNSDETVLSDQAHGQQEEPDSLSQLPREIGGPKGPEPTRYGDWERGGRCSDF